MEITCIITNLESIKVYLFSYFKHGVASYVCPYCEGSYNDRQVSLKSPYYPGGCQQFPKRTLANIVTENQKVELEEPLVIKNAYKFLR